MSRRAANIRSRVRAVAAVIAISSILPACGVLRAGPSRGSGGATPVIVDTVLYVSARARAAGRDTRLLADSLTYGMAMLRRVPGDEDDRSVDRNLVDSVTLSASAFADYLRARTSRQPAPYDFAVLWVHGFGTSLHEAWQYTASAQYQSRSTVPWIAFCWPSNGAGVTWPRVGSLVLGAYRQDSVNAQASRPLFTRALQQVLDAIGAPRTVLATHSLGAQIVSETLAADALPSISDSADARRPGAPRMRLRALAFLAPDVEANRFRDSLVSPLSRVSDRLVLYTAENDRALTLGYLADGFERAGRHTDPPLVHPALETVNITRGETTEGWFQRLAGTHHAIRRKTAMLFDLVHVVGAQRDAGCRTRVGTATPDSTATSPTPDRTRAMAWALTPRRVPPPDSLQSCPMYRPERAP